jgi:hypothetical protein
MRVVKLSFSKARQLLPFLEKLVSDAHEAQFPCLSTPRIFVCEMDDELEAARPILVDHQCAPHIQKWNFFKADDRDRLEPVQIEFGELTVYPIQYLSDSGPSDEASFGMSLGEALRRSGATLPKYTILHGSANRTVHSFSNQMDRSFHVIILAVRAPLTRQEWDQVAQNPSTIWSQLFSLVSNFQHIKEEDLEIAIKDLFGSEFYFNDQADFKSAMDTWARRSRYFGDVAVPSSISPISCLVEKCEQCP